MERRKQEQETKSSPGAALAKSLLASCLITGALLLLIALLFYKLRFPQTVITIAVIATYAISAILGGMLAGKLLRERKFLWGFLAGTLYFVVLVLLSLLVNHGLKDMGTHFFSAMMVCCFGGMLGGMLS